MADNKLHTQLGVVKPIGVQAVGGHLHQAVGGHLHHNGIVSGIQSAGIQSAMHPFGMAVIRKHP